MRRFAALVASSVILTSCALIDSRPTVPEPAPTGTESPTTTAGATTTSIVTEDLIVTGCPAPDSPFSILCETVALIESHYVDPIDLEALAAGAVAGVEELGEPGIAEGTLICAVPDTVAFLDLCRLIDERNTPPDTAVEAAMVGMIGEALDPNSAYLTPVALELTEEDQSGQVEGIGALVTTEDLTSDDPESTPCAVISETCRLVIVSTLEGSPARAAGLQPDDQMISVEGRSIVGRAFDEVTAEVRGPAGTAVTIGFRRGEETFDLTITREAVDIPTVEWEMVGDVGYLRLFQFTLNADRQVRTALNGVLEAGATTIVFDLRNNPGGALSTSVSVASEFLAEGLVLRTEAPGEDIPYAVEPGGVATDPSLPVLVLLNRGSASGSEVVAGALQEAGRAQVIGEPSFGKNTVQQRFPLSNGGAVKLTIARWVTPGGLDFGGDGIQPDVELDLPVDLSVPEVVALALASVQR
jgi:carboxyl-terminal processing protease